MIKLYEGNLILNLTEVDIPNTDIIKAWYCQAQGQRETSLKNTKKILK